MPIAALALALTGCGGGGQAESDGGSTAEEVGPQEYALSVAAFSPFVEKWTVDGESVTFEKVNCLGQAEETAGTWEDDIITWEGENPMLGAGMGLTTLMEPLTDEELWPVGAREVAVPNVDGQMEAHVDKCREAGETVGEILLG
ncbi:hypothetical protein [Brevibacterium album]|uniref:hypothetical protein n=1 Tax=Brevibacterium album TaxID=417948 RepID=UPI0003F88185|nr:hypothetical protein [Brevibacterium album]